MRAFLSTSEAIDEVLQDRLLLGLIQQGDPQALVALYDRYSHHVYRNALRVLRDEAAAEDVTQEVFMQLWVNPMQIEYLDRPLHGWLATASRNRAISLLRRRANDSLEGIDLASPGDFRRSSDQRMACEAMIHKLKDKQQELLQMAFVEEMSHSEIASATGYPLGTIKSAIRSAISSMRKAALASG